MITCNRRSMVAGTTARDALVATCALAAIILVAFGGVGRDGSRDEIVRDYLRGSWVPMSAMFLLLTTYLSLPFGISRSSTFQQWKIFFVAATIIGFLMPTVIAINNPASFPPRLVNTEGLKQAPKQSQKNIIYSSQPEMSLRRKSDEQNVLRIRLVVCSCMKASCARH
jgi:hypothetical protein